VLGEHRVRVTVCDDIAVPTEHDETVGETQPRFEVVLDDHHRRSSGLGEAADRHPHRRRRDRVEHRCRLV
jgi:hypothetical protein